MKISIVIPVYNSSEVLFKLQKSIDQAFSDIKIDYQIVFVDDFSHDNSWEVIRAIKNQTPGKVTAIRMAKNFGQHNAIFCGLQYCTGDFIITMDDDMQHPPAEIPKLIECQKATGADLVYGISKKYKRPLFRRITSRGFKFTTKHTSSSTGEGSSFRMIKQDLAKKLVTHKQSFVFIDELISWYTGNIQFTYVEHNESSLKKSRYSTSKLIKLYFNLVFGYNATLLRLITFLGISSSFISFLVGVLFILKKIFFHIRIGYTGIIVSITFSSGVILLSIGIIGEYLRRMYTIMNTFPQYSISEILE
jgi:glycosyltransferase involved in cell wall biosynthesis